MFISKSQRAKMRKRRKKANKAKKEINKNNDGGRDDDDNTTDDGTSINDPSSAPMKKRKITADDYIQVIEMPEGISGKDAKNFRKHVRREARKSTGNPDVKVKFISKNGNEQNDDDDNGDSGQATNTEAQNNTPDDKNIVDGAKNNERRETTPQRKRKRDFPRINDILREEKLKKKPHEKVTPSLAPEEASKYVAIDCEMVGVGSSGKQSALARVSIVDYHGTVLLDNFVKVLEKVTDYRTFVSGVRAADVRSHDAMDFFDCRKTVGDILRDKILVGHSLRNDLKALMWDHPPKDVRDTARYKPFMRVAPRGGRMKPRKLRDLAKERCGMEIQVEGKPHDSVDDARATMELYKSVRVQWEKDIMSKNKSQGLKK